MKKQIVITIESKDPDKLISKIIKDLNILLSCRKKEGVGINLTVENLVDKDF